ncbi:hypothetical protein NQ318_000550 [Aromia moschata]|uniref:Uncharacterized protein n=1 Tax=Aromia moschata TaxID=1265417 RepID=A0AAV8XYF7_9CUCU|nr:hypothetical protein NQ318_000550 [Aromia moschata]
MSKQANNKRRLTMRGGAMVMRGITLFLAAARSNRGFVVQAGDREDGDQDERRMADKDAIKCSAKVLENVRRDTLFTRDEIESLYKIYKKLVTFNRLTSRGNARQNSTAASIIGKPTTVSEVSINRFDNFLN